MDNMITIIMVAKDSLEKTKKAITSLSEFTDKSRYKILFMDNVSGPETNIWVVNFCRDSGIGLKYQYIGGEDISDNYLLNMAYRLVDTEYSLTCHNGVQFKKYWIENMMRKFEDENVAAVGPVLPNECGLQYVKSAYQTIGADIKYLDGSFFLCRDSVLEQVNNEDGSYLRESLNDCAMMELCNRIRNLGYKLAIARDVLIEGNEEMTPDEWDKKTKSLISLQKYIGDNAFKNLISVEIKKPIRLMVAVLTRIEYVHTRFWLSTLGIWGKTPVYKEVFHIPRGFITARNTMIEEALKRDFTHIIFIDDDMVFNEDAVTKLLCREVDICSGYAIQRITPFLVCQFLANDETKTTHTYEAIDIGFRQVDAVGSFFLLCNLEAIKKIQAPWFKFGATLNGYGMANNEEGIGEDVYFGLKAKMAGLDVYVDTDLEIGHIGSAPIIGKEDHFAFKKLVDEGKRSYDASKEFKVC